MATDTPEQSFEWHKANLKRERERLAVIEAACESPEVAACNRLVIDQRNKVALIEKVLAANAPQTP
jgi:hypothetical protein